MFTGQQIAGLQLASFDAPCQFIHHALFLIKSNMSNHVQIDNPSCSLEQGIFLGRVQIT
jgi:hypothetical protein